ncbi:MAG: hypothetical protein FWE70_08705, partial [Oscillospiraceae bacterium]|nr:hypothetical protein [Oscillospiraceae bacterium]
AALSDGDMRLQAALLRDLKAKGATVVAFCAWDADAPHADLCVRVPRRADPVAYGIPFIFVPQAIALYKAAATGVDPDRPEGLSPWIKL